MQKKLIALAVAGLMSAPVMAQSNVQIYGILDTGVSYYSGSENNTGAATDDSRTGIDSGMQYTSRIGFQGTEDLGNGLSAFFKIEQGLNADRSAVPTNRQTFVGLKGGFGSVRLGRDYTPSRMLISRLDPFLAVGAGNVQNLYRVQTRYDNAIMYLTPSFGGFTVEAAFSNSVSGDERAFASGTANTDTRGFVIVPTYKNGPLMVGLSYERQTSEDPTPGLTLGEDIDTDAWNIAGSYDFGMLSLRGAYGQVDFDRQGGLSSDLEQAMIGLVMPVSEAGSILASVIRVEVDGGDDPKATQWALGYKHALSKRTSVYTTYAKVNTNSAGEGVYGVDDGSGDNVYTKGFNLGITHKF